MKKITFFFRLIHIFYVLAKYRIDTLLVSLPLFKALRFIIYFNPWYWFNTAKHTPGEAVCLALEELGPIFIKLGQALSTRNELFSKDFTQKLSRLQDNVAPFPSSLSQDVIQKAFGKPAKEVFQTFEEVPFASASIAQVHGATLKDGSDVIVKILRPKIRKSIKRDLHVMYSIASILERTLPKSKRLKPREIILEFENTLMDELDLMREAANASQLKRNFEGDESIYVPSIHWDYVRHNILVMERIYGIPVTDMDRLKKEGINLKLLAERGMQIFFTQVFEHCFFHADMHPGNIFVNPDRKESPQYIPVDFGIMGTLTDHDKHYLAGNLLAFFNRDYRRIAQLHIESGWIAKDTRPDVFESAIRSVSEPIYEKHLHDISFGHVLLQFFQTGRRFNMEVQPQLILLQKTLLAVESLGRQLYPELDLWQTAKPFLEKWVSAQVSPCSFMDKMKDTLPYMVERLPHLPKLLIETLESQKEMAQYLKPHTPSPKNTSRFSLGLGTALFSLPLIGLYLSHLINVQNFEILGGVVSAFGALLLIRGFFSKAT
jgi:ubiquinone biosynthesis protein